MNRREALVLMASGFTGTIFGAARMLASAGPGPEGARAGVLTDADRALLNEFGETILPATQGSGGAKAADVAAFMDDVVANFYDERERAAFAAGLIEIESASRGRFSGRGFGELAPPERTVLVMGFERASPQPEFYRMIKQATLWGYFSSEVGATQAMAHVAVPGRYEGVVTVAPSTRAWSN